MKKNGFTLIELLAVIIMIIIIVGLGAPTLINVLKNNKEKAQAKTIEIIESAARSYAIDYGESAGSTICISTLCDKEYLSCPINNAVTATVMNGCVIVTKDANNIESYNYNNSITEIQNTNLAVDLDGGVIRKNLAGTYLPGTTVMLPRPTKSKSEFDHWEIISGNSSKSGNVLTIGTTATTIKAIWRTKTEISFDLNGGKTMQILQNSYAPNSRIILETPTKLKYVFDHWEIISGDSSQSGNVLTIGTTATTIKAIWKTYIQEGLIVWYDGINNTNIGHDNFSTIWEDLSGNNKNGTVNGATWGTNYLNLDGVNDWVSIGVLNQNIYTIEAIVAQNQILSGERILIANFEYGGYGLAFNSGYITSTNYIGGYISNTNPNISVVDHIDTYTSTYDNVNIKLFQNGLFKKQTAKTGNIGIPSSNTIQAIGTNPSGSNSSGSFLNAKVYSVRIYNRALTDEEINHNYQIDKIRYELN